MLGEERQAEIRVRWSHLNTPADVTELLSEVIELPAARAMVGCIHCGMIVGPRDGGVADLVRNHLAECPGHPIRDVEEKPDRLRAALVRCRDSLKEWEAWETTIITDSRCWEPAGMAPLPRLTE